MTGYPLTMRQADFYRSNGYLQLDGVLTEAEIAELAGLTDEMNASLEKTLPPLAERGAYQQVFLQVVNVWRRDPRFRKFTLHPRLAGIARRLIGCQKVRLWHDHLMTKMPGRDSRPTDWHQDTPYWPMNEPGGMSVWIPMQDVELENGCMHFVPESHHWNLHEVIRLDNKEGVGILERVRDKSPEEVRRVYVPLKKGSVTFHNGLTIHAAGKNLSDKPRRVLSVIYMADGTTYNGNPHPVTDEIPDMAKGRAFDGDYFPVLGTEE